MAREARNRGGTNICFDCKKACGNCSWSEIDPETKRPAYKPVEGWKAIKVPYLIGAGSGIDSTYYISECPEFEPDEGFQPTPTFMRACMLCGASLEGEAKNRKYCFGCVPMGYSRNPNTGALYRNTWWKHQHRKDQEE